MESNLGTIDLKELLVLNSASQELDESSPLSAPDLHVLKDRLQIRSLQIKDRVSKYVKSHYQDFFRIISGAFHAASEIENISESLNEILLNVDRPGNGRGVPIDVELCQLVAERGSLKKDLEEKVEVSRLIITILVLFQRLQDANRNVEQGRLVEAAGAIQALRTAVRVPDNWKEDEFRVSWDISEPKAFTMLKIEWISCASKLQQLLEDLFENAVQVDNANSKLNVNLHIECGKLPESVGGVDLASVLTAMEVTGILDSGFAKLADSLIKYIMIPVIHNSTIHIVSDESVKNNPVLSWTFLSNMETERLAPGSLYSKLLHVLKFVHQYICFENGNWMKLIGRLTWPRISETVITNCLAKAVPDDVSEVSEFQKVVKLTRDFEHELKDMMFISTTANENDRLSNFALNIEVHFASKKKNQILARVRQVLVKSDFRASSENAVELLFWPATCTVSSAVKQLMETVHEALKDACLSPRRIAVEFYHAARDALLLYKAIVPVKLAKELNILSEAAIIVHNDCLYLAQEILGLAFEYRASLPNGLKGNAVFVDLAPLFHKLAEEMLDRQIDMVLSGLKEALDQANGFQNTHKKQQSEMANLAVDQAVLFLEKVRLLWQPLLKADIYKKAMRSILEHFFARICSEILLLDDMAVEETVQLRGLVQIALKNMTTILNSIIDEEMRMWETAETFDKNEKNLQSSWDQFEKLIPSLQKLRRITDLLDMPLKSITLAWETGELIVCGFTSLEVQKLIRAVFSDTLLRKECLKRIENTDFL